MLNARSIACRLLLGTALTCAVLPACAADYYVDFNTGHDTDAGTSTSTPWQHAPGDANAIAGPATVKLSAGDRVLFHGGIAYRGHIFINRVSGTSGNPIRYVGDAWGLSKAIMHGGEPLGVGSPCLSQSACGGSPAWRSIRVYPSGNAAWTDFVTDNGPLTQVAQYPQPDGSMSYDDLTGFIPIAAADEPLMNQGAIRFTGALPGSGAQLALWAQGNVIDFTTSVSVAANLLTFTPPANFQGYPGRTNYYAVVNDPTRLVAPGQFAVTAGSVYYWPTGTASPWVGARRQGFELLNSNYVSIEGFVFTGFSSDGTARSGVAIGTFSGHTDGLVIQRNDFTNMALKNSQAAVQLLFVNETTIRNNTFNSLVWASGVRIVSSMGPVSVTCNTFASTGRTALYLQDVLTSEIAYNYVDNINSIHGNAISLYLDVRQSRVHDNVVTNSLRPLTFQYNGRLQFDPSIPAAISVAGNVFDVTGTKAVAVQSWGSGIHNVALSANMLIGAGKVAVWGPADYDNTVIGANIGPPTLSAAAQLLASKAAVITRACSN